MMTYPMQLPEWDTVRMILDDKENLAGTEASKQVMDPTTCELWSFGKRWERDHKVHQAINTKNEKTVIVVKLTRRGAGAPSREPILDETQQKNLMKIYHKKDEEGKRLSEQDHDDAPSYMNSDWANPKSYRSHAQGLTSQIKFKTPFG